MEIVASALTTIMIAAVSSWITVQLSLRRFRTEKWWERRVAAYERLIEVLHHSKAFFERHLKASYEGWEISEERDNKLRVKAREAGREIAKAVDLGGFLLGAEARARLKRYKKDEDFASDTTSWDEHLHRDWEATNSCLQDLIGIARRDLKTDRHA